MSGPYVWSAGWTIRDRERALSMLPKDDWLQQLVGDFFPSARAEGVRKGWRPEAVARALLLWSLKVRFGLRPAARLIIVWDHELQTPYSDARVAGLIRRYEDGQPLGDDEGRTRMGLESAVIKTSQGVWRRVGLDSASSFRI